LPPLITVLLAILKKSLDGLVEVPFFVVGSNCHADILYAMAVSDVVKEIPLYSA